MLRLLDIVLTVAVVGIGVLHNFVVAPQQYDTLSTDALWFIGTGVAIWFAALLNALRIMYRPTAPATLWTAVFANVVLIGLATAFGFAIDDFSHPLVWGQMAVYGGLALISFRPAG